MMKLLAFRLQKAILRSQLMIRVAPYVSLSVKCVLIPLSEAQPSGFVLVWRHACVMFKEEIHLISDRESTAVSFSV